MAQHCTPREKGESMPKQKRQPPRGAPDTEKLRVRFKDREAFGHFCVTLADDQVPFALAGCQTVILAKTHLDHLPTASLCFYRACVKEDLVEQPTPIAALGSRHLPTPEETEKLLREVAEHY